MSHFGPFITENMVSILYKQRILQTKTFDCSSCKLLSYLFHISTSENTENTNQYCTCKYNVYHKKKRQAVSLFWQSFHLLARAYGHKSFETRTPK